MAQTRLKSGNLHMVGGDNGTSGQVLKSRADGTFEWGEAINPPTFSSVDYPGSITALDPAGGESLVINGTNFNTGITITIDGTTPSSITLNSSTQLTVTTPAKSAGTYNIVFTNTDGGTATAINAVSYNGVPSWTTAAGNLGSVDEGASISFTVTATEPDGGAITYAVTSGALPSGASLNTSTGAITGTASAVNATTTSTFTITATDNENQTAAREFNIIVENDGPSKHFNIATWTGDGTTNRDISAGFDPSLIIIKKRSITSTWYVLDAIRGNGTYIYTDAQSANDYNANHGNLTSTGLNTSGGGALNTSGVDYISYFWKASAATPVSNTDGSITSTVDYHSGKGFSIVKYTGTGSGTPTVGHGMSTAPQLIWFKNITSSQNWFVFFKPSGGNTTLWEGLNSTAGALSTNYTGFTIGSSTVSFSGNDFNSSGKSYIMYCWHDVSEFSKFGTYTGNNSTDGPIVNLGFEPAFLMIKRSDSSSDWGLWDNKKTTTNPRNIKQNFNDNSAQSSANTALNIDFLTNGFRIRNTNVNTNASGGTYFYMAFAADPNTTSPTLANSFNAVNYTGNLSNNGPILNIGFNPGFVWLKARETTSTGDKSHRLHDVIRGQQSFLKSDSTDAASSSADRLNFNYSNTEIQIKTASKGWNDSGYDYVAWAWKANSLPSINTDGSSDSIVSVNANAGFSIVRYVGNQTAGHTIGHGLGVKPDMIILKCLDSTNPWYVYHTGVDASNPAHYNLRLNGNDARQDSTTEFNDTEPTSSVFTLGTTTGTNKTNNQYIAYCFHSVSGFSKIGSYSGGSTGSGNVITTGFQPDWILIKRTDTADDWTIIDSVRGDGASSRRLIANTTEAEKTATSIWYPTSTGFYFESTGNSINASGGTYIYAAFKIN